jgi:hypothetical protein
MWHKRLVHPGLRKGSDFPLYRFYIRYFLSRLDIRQGDTSEEELNPMDSNFQRDKLSYQPRQ